MKMRNTPSPITGKTDIIDRHTKKRLIVVDSSLVLAQASQNYMMLLIDLAEISDYFDVLVVAKPEEVDYVREYCDHWMLKCQVRPRYAEYQEILADYHILFCFTTARNKEKFKKFYHVDCLSR